MGAPQLFGDAPPDHIRAHIVASKNDGKAG